MYEDIMCKYIYIYIYATPPPAPPPVIHPFWVEMKGLAEEIGPVRAYFLNGETPSYNYWEPS